MRIEIDNLCFGYSADAPVLHDISLNMEEPGLYCIIGPNGVGKSTLVKCITRLVKPTSGAVRMDGTDIAEIPRRGLSELVGYVPAVTFDCFSMPVIDTILIGRHNHQKWKTTPKDLAIVRKTMALLDLEEYAMRGYNDLSAGQHQRVSLARGLVQETPVLVLDEPTANLDIKHQVYVAQLLRGIAEMQGKIVIMICHDLNIAARYAHKVIVMAPPGVVYSVGEPGEVVTEKMVGDVYGIDCSVVTFEGSPHVILKSSFVEPGDGPSPRRPRRRMR